MSIWFIGVIGAIFLLVALAIVVLQAFIIRRLREQEQDDADEIADLNARLISLRHERDTYRNAAHNRPFRGGTLQ